MWDTDLRLFKPTMVSAIL